MAVPLLRAATDLERASTQRDLEAMVRALDEVESQYATCHLHLRWPEP
jgi:hypothetical protein